ncbi:MAG: TlpA disulfide reductase family protein [Vicingaceae bacterium]|jgi:thiol-disulfide isomerase/thioredoxin
MSKFLIVFFLFISCYCFSQQRAEMTDLEKARYDSTLIGQTVPEFSLLNSTLSKVNISKFKGVNLIVDIWATWCVPCLKEAPYFHELKEKYENDTLKFISISVDNFPKEWLTFLEAKGIKKEAQYFAGYDKNHPVIWFVTNIDIENGKYHSYSKLPRFLIIDKNQKIINREASVPSEEKMLEEIRALK